MMNVMIDPAAELRQAFPEALQEGALLARYTSARIGGPADYLLTARSATELESFASWLWERELEFVVLGGGSNVLISDQGIRGVTILNHARSLSFQEEGDNCTVHAESGANLGAIARQAAQQGYSGLEWAAGIPGTIGGAVVGNAGAHGGDMSVVILLADILHHIKGRESWTVDDLKFEYRSSYLKSIPGHAMVLAAQMKLERKPVEEIEALMDSYLAHRRKTQPPGASMGSMFKNPPDDFAGRLIEVAGLKGKQIGQAQISPLHGNFFLNLGDAKAADVRELLRQAQSAVEEQFGIKLEPEIGMLGEWPDKPQ